VGIFGEKLVVDVGHGCSIFSANPTGSVSVPRSYTCTQYCPASACVLICGVAPGDAFTDTPSLHPPPLVRGNPTPRPSVGPAVSVTTIVPAEFSVNDRVLAPPGATTLDQLSVIGPDGLLGVVGVSSLPQPASIIATLIPIMSHRGMKARRRTFLTLRASVSPWFVWVNVAAIMDVISASKSSRTHATLRHPQCSRSSRR